MRAAKLAEQVPHEPLVLAWTEVWRILLGGDNYNHYGCCQRGNHKHVKNGLANAVP